MSFKDKTAWITGASSGIGKSLALALHRRGARLIISSRRAEALEEVKAACREDTPDGGGGSDPDIRILPLDLSDADSLPARAEEALNCFGSIDYLFNNGGISQRSYAVETDMEVIRKVMEVNFFGTVALTKQILPAMLERRSGHIVITSSVMGKFGTRLRSTYAASKHALHGYFDSLRQEVYDHDVQVTLVCPGFIKTNVTLNALQGDGTVLGQMGRGQEQGMDPDEFAEKLLPQLLKGKEEIYIGGKEVWGVYLKRFAPTLFHKILRNSEVT